MTFNETFFATLHDQQLKEHKAQQIIEEQKKVKNAEKLYDFSSVIFDYLLFIGRKYPKLLQPTYVDFNNECNRIWDVVKYHRHEFTSRGTCFEMFTSFGPLFFYLVGEEPRVVVAGENTFTSNIKAIEYIGKKVIQMYE